MARYAFAIALAASLPIAWAGQFVMYSPGGDDTSVQRIDPILSPGSIAQHVHQVFGANALSDTVTYDSLQQSTCTTVGGTDGYGIAYDNSLYWHPALFMEAKNGSGYVRVPTSGHKLYYRDAGTSSQQTLTQFPKGFRMIAGNPFLRKANADKHLQDITQWICHRPGTWAQGPDGGFPSGVNDCTDYPGFNGAIHFPHCWNGQDFDPSNPFAHVVYPDGHMEDGKCPDSHTIRLPHIFIENQFDLHKVVDQVVPNTFTLAQGDRTGYGWHLDFFNGWQDGILVPLIQNCPQPQYGNEDVKQCNSGAVQYKPRSVKAQNCKLPVTYHEEVSYPGQYLPGCNPVSYDNPAPLNPVAPLGVATDVCSAVNAPVASSSPSAQPNTMSTSPVQSSPSPATSITKAAGTTEYAAPSAFSVPSTFATYFTTTTSSSSAQPPASSAPSQASFVSSVSCPGSDGATYVSNGATFQIECHTDHKGGDLSMKYVSSLQGCIDACASTAGCVDVSLSGTACYMKKSLGVKSGNTGVHGAKLISKGSTTITSAGAGTTHRPYGNAMVVDDDYETETAVFTEYVYATVTAQPDMHRRHALVHGI